MTTRHKKAEVELEGRIEEAFRKFGNRVEMKIMDLPRIMRDAKLEHSAGVPLEEAMPAIIERYRVKG